MDEYLSIILIGIFVPIAIFLLVLIIFPGWFCNAIEPPHEQYARAAVVLEVDDEINIVTFVDGCGFRWKIKGVFDWHVGDLAALLMDNNGTPGAIIDDVIVDAWYSALGWQMREGIA